MKSSLIFSLLTCAALSWVTLPSANAAGTIDAKTNAATAKAAAAKGASAKGATNAEPASLPLPASVFDLAANPLKDPFFPQTIRTPFPKDRPKEIKGVSPNSFHLAGMSGANPDRLAIINHRTLGLGETMEVPIGNNGKATIRVVQFKDTSVIIRVVTPPQPDLIELALPKRDQ